MSEAISHPGLSLRSISTDKYCIDTAYLRYDNTNMIQENTIILFKEQAIRRIWHEEQWWFSVVDICSALTDSPDGGAYWRKLKQRLKTEGNQSVTNCHELKLPAPGE